MWSFAIPAALLLLPLPLVVMHFLRPVEAATDALRVPPTIAAGLERAESIRLLGAARRTLPWAIWLCLVVALAGPQRLAPAAALPASGRDIVLVLDLSGSMETEDFELDGRPVQRLDALKRVAARFARGRAGDRLGLVVFGEDAFFAAPMTYDVEAVARAVEEATIGISGRSTAISDGLGLALKRLKESDAASRVIVLLSDGVDTSGTVAPVGAAKLADDLGIRLHTIAMGPHAVGEANPTRDAVDAPTLAAMAEAAGGTAFRVRTTVEFEAVSAAIDDMEPSLRDRAGTAFYRPLWPWPAGLAGLLTLLGLAGPGRLW